MKKIILVLLPVFIMSSIASAQVLWQELPAHNADDMEILHVQDDRMLGRLDYPSSLHLSEDRGETWSVVVDEIVLENRTPLVDIDSEGNYLILNERTVYKLDKDDNSYTLLIDLGDGIWNGIGSLSNGNIVIRGRNELWLFSMEGDYVRHHDFGNAVTKQLMVSESDEHFFFLSPGNVNGYIVRFDSELELLEQCVDDEFYVHSHYAFDGNRLYSDTGYSDDGKTWTDYPNDLTGHVTLLKNGNVHLLATCRSFGRDVCDKIYLSEDRGQSFSYVGDLPFEFILPSAGSADLRGTTLMGSESFEGGDVLLYHEKANWYSPNGVDDWRELKKDQGNPFAQIVEAASVDNVITGTSYYQEFYTVDSGNAWQALDDSVCPGNFRVVSMPDGSLVNSNGCHSEDGGVTWVDRGPSESWIVYLKDDLVYMYDGSQMGYTSEDFGRNWNAFQMTDPDVLIEADVFDLSSTGFLYIHNYWPEEGFFKYEFRGGSRVALDFGEKQILSVKTPYLGPEVFVLTTDFGFDPNIEFFVSLDDAVNFEQKPLPPIQDLVSIKMHTDHLGNLFLYSSSEIWMSDDNGDTWSNISPQHPDLVAITSIDVSWDGYLFASTLGTAILRSQEPLEEIGKLTVTVYEDVNGNCAYDPGETRMNNILVDVDDRRSRTNAEGSVSFLMNVGEYNVSASFRDDLYESCDNDHRVVIERQGDDAEIFIPLNVIEQCTDVGVSTTIPFLRRCFDNRYFLDLYNDGTSVSTDTRLTLELDQYYEYVDCTFDLESQNGNTYTFYIGDIETRQRVSGVLDFVLSCDAGLGEAHYMTGVVSHDNLCEEQLQDKESFECRENIGSYDPNDKSIYIDGVADAEVINETSEIEYLIRFQNTGTDTAFTVRIEDQLSEDFIHSSLSPVAASHDYEWTVNRNRLVVTFNDIDLVDSIRNEPASHGFVKFKVSLSANRPQPGEVVENQASIYFDFNEPIITNTVEAHYICQHSSWVLDVNICPGDIFEWNEVVYDMEGRYENVFLTEEGCDSTVVLLLSFLDEDHEDCQTDTTLETLDSDIYLYPNPVKDLLTIENQGSIGLKSCNIYDMTGSSVLKQHILDPSGIDVSGLDTGVYMMDILTQDGKHFRKRVVIVR